MARLPPLRVPKKPIGLGSRTGSVAMGDLPDGVPGKIELGSLAKKTSDLLQVYMFIFYMLIRSFVM